MVALLSFMTSLVLVGLGLGVVFSTLRGSGAKILAALAGDRMSAAVIPFPVHRRRTARVTMPAFQNRPPPLRAAA